MAVLSGKILVVEVVAADIVAAEGIVAAGVVGGPKWNCDEGPARNCDCEGGPC